MQKIVIDNFGPVKHAEIEIKPLLVLIGEQATGKSTIAKLIYFFKTLSEDFRKHYYGMLTLPKDLDSELIKVTRKKFFEYFGSDYYSEKATITYFYSENKTVSICIGAGAEFGIRISEGFFDMGGLGQQLRSIKAGLLLRIASSDDISDAINMFWEQNRVEQLNKFSELINQIFCNSHNDLAYIIAGRNATISYSDFYDGMLTASLFRMEAQGTKENDIKEETADEILTLEFLQRVSRMRQQLNKSGNFAGVVLNAPKENIDVLNTAHGLICDVIKGDYISGTDEKITLEGNKYVYLKNASSGQKESIRILQDAFLGINSGNNVFRVIEEPEAHIFPEAQMYLLQLLAILLNNTENNQLIITTHSPYVLTVINNLMHAYSVGQNNPEKVREIVNEYSWIDPKKVNAYMLTIANGAERIIDDEVNMIDAEKIDGVSEKLNEDYDKLLDIEYGNGEEK